MALQANTPGSDTPTWNEAINGPLADGFHEICMIEMTTLEDKEAWEVVDRTPDMKVLSGTWAFRIKRFPDGLIKKLKARFCVRGDRQEYGIDFFETFAPVVSWTTIRIMFVVSLMLGLYSCQVDYTAAFVQAPMPADEVVYVEMPRGFKVPG